MASRVHAGQLRGRALYNGQVFPAATEPGAMSAQEHCLMGIRGTVRRAQDGHIIHRCGRMNPIIGTLA